MKRIVLIYGLLLCLALSVAAQEKVVKLKIVETSDVHGNYYPYNFITRHEWKGSLARVYSFVQKEREQYKENLILLDNGDILQGQPTAYYYNYIDTVSPHLCSEMMNYMKYDAGNMGNHDVETGRAVFDRWIATCDFPVLGANIIDTSTGQPHLAPYKVLERDGVKIVVLGMITPAIPAWLSENLWKGLRFDDMEETARKWMKVIREKENPDLVIGLFHAGQEAFKMSGKYNENASLNVAKNVPGFDIVLMGHDHSRECKKVMNVAGDSVLIIDPASNGIVLSNVDVTLKLKDGKVQSKDIKGVLTETEAYGISEEFMKRFAPQYETVQKFVSKKIGTFTESISTHSAFFGPSAFIDLIHTLQLDITGADISFAAPLAMGITSDGEYFDGEFESVTTSREMIDALNAVSVDEMKVTECVLLPDDAKNSMSVVSASDYVISFLDKAGTEERHNILDSVESFMSQDQIIILKKTKKSEREENIKPGIMTCELRDDQIYMLLSTGSEYNLKPELVMQALCAYADVSHNQFHYHIHRLETYMDGPDGNIIPLYKAGSPF